MMTFVAMITRDELGQDVLGRKAVPPHKVEDTLDMITAALTAPYVERRLDFPPA